MFSLVDLQIIRKARTCIKNCIPRFSQWCWWILDLRWLKIRRPTGCFRSVAKRTPKDVASFTRKTENSPFKSYGMWANVLSSLEGWIQTFRKTAVPSTSQPSDPLISERLCLMMLPSEGRVHSNRNLWPHLSENTRPLYYEGEIAQFSVKSKRDIKMCVRENRTLTGH